MNYKLKYLLSLALLICVQLQANTFSVFNLRCEHETNPLGIENKQARFSWQINSVERGFEQSAWQLLVADSPQKLDANQGDLWDSGKVLSSASALARYEGRELESGKRYYWKVKIWDKQGNSSQWSTVNSFDTGLFTKSDWSDASWIALEKDKKDEIITTGIHSMEIPKSFGDKKTGMYKLPQFRKEVNLKKRVKRAMTYISGLGHFEMFVNGEKVGTNFLDPGWTKYDKHALYVTFDITSLLREGNNALGIMLGNGFYNIPRERYFKLLTSYGAPKVCMKTAIEYEDGTVENIVTNSGWKVTESPITYSSIYGGEDYDAQLEHTNWMKPNYDDKQWEKIVDPKWQTNLFSQRAAPLKVKDRIPVTKLFQTEKGDWIYDLGQNFSGIFQLKVRGQKGSRVTLHPAELLNEDKTVNQSESGYPCSFSYTSKSSEIESWQPQFTYYGFRYVQIEGAVPAGKDNPQNLPVIEELTGLHTTYSAEEAGTFKCSNQMFNKIYTLIDWGIRSNMASVLTDCPHREKLGWLEQAYLMQYSIQYRYNTERLYEKVLQDIVSTQATNGQVPTTAPEFVEFSGGFKDTPEWGSALIISAWYAYQWYGDDSQLRKYYKDMQQYVDFLSSKANDHIISYGLGDWFDIGPNRPGSSQLTSNGVTATATYYYDVKIMEQISELIGEKANAEKYKSLAQEIKQSFNKIFWNAETQKYDRDSQAANAIALYTDIVEEQNRERVFANLVADIRSRDNALTAGDVGYRYVLRALEANNASDIIYDMNSKYDVPGYGWQLAHDATALTESWQAYGFVSNNHMMLGHLMEWIFSALGGIKQHENSIAFKTALIKAEPVGDVYSANSTYQSPYGLISSDWKDTDSEFLHRVEIPANSFAYIHLPTKNADNILESGLPIAKSQDLKVEGTEGNYTVVKLGSGIYNFRVVK